jgi:modulator of FtsH protease HflK
MDVTMQPASAPEPVKDAFDDVIKAREDKTRAANEAMAYVNQVVPAVKGQASQMGQLAKARAIQSVNNANADVAGFEALLPQYLAAPNITETRLYFETMEKILAKNRVIIAADKGNNVFYLSDSNSSVFRASPNMGIVASTEGTQAVRGDVGQNSAPISYSRWQQAQVNDSAQGDFYPVNCLFLQRLYRCTN